MKLLIAFCLVFIIHGATGKHMEMKNCGGSSRMMTLNSLIDINRRSQVDKYSKLDITFTTGLDTKSQDPFEVDIKVNLYKYVIAGYVPIPKFVMNSIGKNIHDPHIKYRGNRVFRVYCPFLYLYGSCLPPKGTKSEIVDMGPLLSQLKQLGGLMRWLASGWYKLNVDAHTLDGRTAFCFSLELKLKL